MLSLCVWPLVIVTGLLFFFGLAAAVTGRFRGKFHPLELKYPFILGGWARVLGVLMMLPFCVAIPNLVVDLLGLFTNDSAWDFWSWLLLVVQLAALIVCGGLALVLYWIIPKTYPE